MMSGPQAPHFLENLLDLEPEGVGILQLPENEEFDQEFLDSQQNLGME